MKLSSIAIAVTVIAGSAAAASVGGLKKNNNAVKEALFGGVEEETEGLKLSKLNLYAGKSANALGVKVLDEADGVPSVLRTPLGVIPELPDGDDDDESHGSNYNSFLMSISMIVVSEIGDKTFLIAALMAMRHSRYIVFSSAFASLAVMTVLSGLVGHALPALISRRLTQFLASVLFIVFGFKLLNEGRNMSKDLGVEDELAEVEEEIAHSSQNAQLDSLESGLGNSTTINSKLSWLVEFGTQIKDLASFVLSPIWIQVFVMTFLGEWGDRSQIATIAMAAGSEYWFVILGAIIGHFICTAAACIGGKLLAKKISMRNVTLGGAIAFFLFAILYFYSAYYDIE